MFGVGSVDVDISGYDYSQFMYCLDERGAGEKEAQTRMPMRSPSDLGSSAYDVCEYVGGRPWIGVIYQAIDFVIRSVVDSESLLDEVFPDECS